MATENEKTLQIKDFKTISRFYSSPNEDPNSLNTIQNMYNVTQGELGLLGGIEKLSNTAMPGLQKIVGTQIMTLKDGSKRQLVYGTPSFTSITNNTANTDFAGAGTGGATNRAMVVVYVGFGGAVSSQAIISVPFKSLGTTYTLRNDIPTYVAQILFYVGPGNTTYITGGGPGFQLMAAISRKDNVFPASITFTRTPYDLNAGGTVANFTIESIPYYFSCSATSGTVTGSSLRENNIYYMGVCPSYINQNGALSQTQLIPEVALYDQANGYGNGPTNLLSFTLPKGYTEYAATFYGMPYILNAPAAAAINLALTPLIDNFNGFIGITPEDVALNPDTTNDGKFTPNGVIAEDSNTGVPDTGTDKVSVGVSAITSYKEGMPIRISAAAAADTMTFTGYTAVQVAANYFFVKAVDAVAGTFQVAASPGGTALDIDGAGTGTQNFYIRKVTFKFHTIPENNSLSNFMGRYPTPYGGQGGILQDPTGGSALCASPLRSYGTFNGGVRIYISGYNNNNDYTTLRPDRNLVGIWALKSSTFATTTAYQILPCSLDKTFTLDSTNQNGYTGTVAMPFFMYNNGYWNNQTLNEPNFFFQKYVWRNYSTNAGQVPFYNNGYVCKPIQRDSNSSTATPPNVPSAIPPMSAYITLINNKLVVAGGIESFANSKGVFYYTDPSNPNGWGAPTSATAPAPWNFFALDNGDPSDINGLGYYAQNLTQSGPAAFALISKSNTVYSWNGQTGTSAIVAACYNGSGFIGPRAFAVTNLGPCFVGKDNVYFVQSGNQIVPIGNEVKPIILALGNMGKFVTAIFHNNIFKFAYTPTITTPTPDTALLDKEIWMQLNVEQGETTKRFTGPHTLKSMYYEGNGDFGTYPDMRISSNDANLYLRDSTSVFTNDGSPIQCAVTWNQLTLQADHFWKVLTRLYARCKVNETITATITVSQYDQDGAGQGNASGTPTTYTGSMTWTYNGPPQSYRLFQTMFSSRIRGDIFIPSITFSTSTDTRIVDVSFLYNVQRRRLL